MDRRERLKELERQKRAKEKNGIYANRSREKEQVKSVQENGGHAASTSRGSAAGPAPPKARKLPYDRSFGSFFGPSEPVVARRIIEEARARQEADMAIAAASREKASQEAERKKVVARSSAAKSSHDKIPSQRPPPKPVDKATEKAQKLKEARDYSFLFDDSPLPNAKLAEKKVAASLKPDVSQDFNKSASARPSNMPLRKTPLGLSKTRSEATASDRPPTSSRLSHSQSKSVQPSKAQLSQRTRDYNASDRSATQNMRKVTTAAKSVPSKMSSAGPGRPDPRREAELKDTAMRKLVAGSPTSNGSNRFREVKHSLPSQSMDRRPSETLDRRPTQATDRRPSAQATDRRPAQATDRRPSAQATDRRPDHFTEKRPAQASDRRLLSSQASERRPVVAQGLKKGASASATNRAAVGGIETRQRVLASQAGRKSLQPKSAPKGGAKPAPSNQNRGGHSDDRRRGVNGHKRARSLSEDSDDGPRPKKDKLRRFGERGRRSMSEEDDDSFIDDDDERPNVSSLIQKIMGYNPDKYRGNDDFDDRLMEVGFHHIQAEERRSAREARLEDEHELKLIEAEEKAERLRKAKKKRKQTD